jgi:hypothetical protein
VHDLVGELRRRCGAAEITRPDACVHQSAVECRADASRGGSLADVIEHHAGRQQERRRVRDVLARDVRRAAVYGFEYRATLAEIGAGHESEAAHESRAQVRHDVAVEIGKQQHVELFRPHDEVHADSVDDLFVVFDLRMFRGDGAHRLQEEPVAELHDVGFVDRRDGAATVPARVVERELRDPRRRPGRNDLQALDDAGYDLMLEASIEIFGVLADDHEVDVFEASGYARQIPDRPQIGV